MTQPQPSVGEGGKEWEKMHQTWTRGKVLALFYQNIDRE